MRIRKLVSLDKVLLAPESLKASPRAQRRMVGSIPTDSLAKAPVPFCPPESWSVVPGHDHDRVVAIGAPLHRVIPGHRDDLAAFVQRADALRERELRKEGREVPSRVRLREGPIGVRITLGQPTIG